MKLNFGKKQKRKQNSKIKKRFIKRFDWVNKFDHWYLGTKSMFRSVFRAHAAKQTIIVILAILSSGYVMAAFYTGAGEFVINIDQKMAKDGFYLSETPKFDEKLITLKSTALQNATNINIYDIPDNVSNIDGEHHGKNYFAYTFYLKNATGDAKDYRYTLFLRSSTKEIENASWVMLYHNGKQETYAMENAGKRPECQFSEFPFPFSKDARDPGKQQILLTPSKMDYLTNDIIKTHEFGTADGIYELKTTPFASSQTICSEFREEIQADEVDKFTVVIWLEGEDPECIDDIIGGELELGMKFTYN